MGRTWKDSKSDKFKQPKRINNKKLVETKKGSIKNDPRKDTEYIGFVS